MKNQVPPVIVVHKEGCFLQTLNAGCIIIFIIIAFIVISLIWASNSSSSTSKPTQRTQPPQNSPSNTSQKILPVKFSSNSLSKTTMIDEEIPPQTTNVNAKTQEGKDIKSKIIIPDWNARRAELKAIFLASFIPPKINSQITITLKQGNSFSGILKNITTNEIQIQTGPATITFVKSQLVPTALVKFFADDNANMNAETQLSSEIAIVEARRKEVEEKEEAELKERQQAELLRADEEKKRIKAEKINKLVSEAQLVMDVCRWGVEYDFVIAHGQVANITNRKMENIEAVMLYYAADGSLVKSASALVKFNPIMPGQWSTYEVITDHNPAIVSARVEFKSLFGGKIQSVTKAHYDSVKQ